MSETQAVILSVCTGGRKVYRRKEKQSGGVREVDERRKGITGKVRIKGAGGNRDL